MPNYHNGSQAKGPFVFFHTQYFKQAICTNGYPIHTYEKKKTLKENCHCRQPGAFQAASSQLCFGKTKTPALFMLLHSKTKYCCPYETTPHNFSVIL